MTEDNKPVRFGLTSDEIWKIWLTEGDTGFFRIAPKLLGIYSRLEHKLLHAVPSDPRCVSCMAPFRGIGSPFMRAIGRERSQYNPSMCRACEKMATKTGAKAEVPVTMLFADIRDSTKLAEEMHPIEFQKLVSRFYTDSSNILVKSGAMIDKLIGDEVSAYWVPGIAGQSHAKLGFEGAKKILEAVGYKKGEDPWVPVGIGVHTGLGVVGVVGQREGVNDITVLGDVANTAARLAAIAKAGEIIISDDLLQAAKVDTATMKMRNLRLKGKSNEIKTWTTRFQPDKQ